MTARHHGARDRTEAARFRDLMGRLTARDRWLLAMLAEHGVLTTSQLLRLGWATGRRRAQNRTRALHQDGVVDRFRPVRPRGEGSAPWHFVLGPHGAAALAAETGHTTAEIGYRGRTRALAIAHRMTLAHDVAANDLLCDLAANPEIALHQWWSAARCGRCFGHHVRPDAYLTLTTPPPPRTRTEIGSGAGIGVGAGWWEMFLEYDTGTESLTRLAAKLRGYFDLAAATGIVTAVGIWIARPGREPGARRALTDALRALPRPELVPVLTATPHTALRQPAGAAATATTTATAAAAGRVWLPVPPPGRAVERVSLAALAARRALPVAAGERPERSRDTSVLAAPSPIPPRPGDLR